MSSCALDSMVRIPDVGVGWAPEGHLLVLSTHMLMPEKLLPGGWSEGIWGDT